MLRSRSNKYNFDSVPVNTNRERIEPINNGIAAGTIRMMIPDGFWNCEKRGHKPSNTQDKFCLVCGQDIKENGNGVAKEN